MSPRGHTFTIVYPYLRVTLQGKDDYVHFTDFETEAEVCHPQFFSC